MCLVTVLDAMLLKRHFGSVSSSLFTFVNSCTAKKKKFTRLRRRAARDAEHLRPRLGSSRSESVFGGGVTKQTGPGIKVGGGGRINNEHLCQLSTQAVIFTSTENSVRKLTITVFYFLVDKSRLFV